MMSRLQVLPTMSFLPLPTGMGQTMMMAAAAADSPPSAQVSAEDLHAGLVPGKKKKIQRSKNACTACHKSRAKCDGGTPCSRCIRIGAAHVCEPFAGKKRGRKSGFSIKATTTTSSSSSSASVTISSSAASTSVLHGLFYSAPKGSYVQEVVIESPDGSDAGLHSSSSSSPSVDQNQPMTPGVMFPNFSTFDPLGFSFEGYTQFPDASSPYQHHHHSHHHSHHHHDYYGNDALVPSFPQKDVILKTIQKPFIPPSINLRKDSRKLIYICSATQSFATMVGRPHRDVEGTPFRDFIPKKIYKGCLMTWFQKYTDLRDKGNQYITFKTHTLLMGPNNSLVPVELTTIIVEDPTGEISIIRMDVQELTTSEALILGLPLFDPNLDFEDPNDANCEKEALRESCRHKHQEEGTEVPDDDHDCSTCG